MRKIQCKNAHGQVGTKLLAFSLSMAFTSALQPVSVSTINGTVFTFSFISLLIKPGCTQLTFIGVCITSMRMPSLNEVMAAFVAA